MMPDLDGLEVARELRSTSETSDIPIIMFTAKSQLDDKLEGFDAGADAYLTKPTQPRELVAQVKAVLARSSKGRTAAAPARPPGERGKLIGVLSAKGGVGVTTLVTNLAFALKTQSKKEVVVSDFRPGCGSMGLELGFTDADGFSRLFGLSPVEITPALIESELVAIDARVRFLLSSPNPRDNRYITSLDHFEAIMNNLAYLAPFTILDLGAGLSPLAVKISQLCQQVIVVVEPIPQSVILSRALLEALSEIGVGEDRVLTALINRVRSGIQLSLSHVQDLLGSQISSIFTASPELTYQAQVQSKPLVVHQPEGLAAQQYNTMADKLLQRIR
jgi:MinD-like ATPase involved in chromosome partitioning or flagellar assembly